MRKAFTILILMCCCSLMLNAQRVSIPKGEYKKTITEKYPNIPTQELYAQAIVVMSDWTGVEGKSRSVLSGKNSKTHTATYTGKFYLGRRKVMPGKGQDIWLEFMLKLQCMEGKVLFSIVIPAIISKVVNTNNAAQQSFNTDNQSGDVFKSIIENDKRIDEVATTILKYAKEKMKDIFETEKQLEKKTHIDFNPS